jgi:hypothetical protein
LIWLGKDHAWLFGEDVNRPLQVLPLRQFNPQQRPGIGITGAVAQFCITRAFLLAPASVIAPFEYTALLWGGLLDWFVWRSRPTLPMLAGAALIVGSGIYVMLANAGTAPAERLAAECDPHP